MSYFIKKATHDVIGYKKVEWRDAHGGARSPQDRAIALLLIPKNTRVGGEEWKPPTRFKPNQKYRAEKAIVLGFINPNDHSFIIHPEKSLFVSIYNWNFIYEIGETITPTFKFSMAKEECESGIHFFRTYQEAERYSW